MVEAGQADTQPQGEPRLFEEDSGGEFINFMAEEGSDSLGDLLGLGNGAEGQKQREFIAPIPGGDIAGPNAGLEQLPDKGKDIITDEVAEAVIDELEMVNIDHQAGQIGAVFFGLFKKHLQVVVEGGTIDQAGQVVGLGGFFQLPDHAIEISRAFQDYAFGGAAGRFEIILGLVEGGEELAEFVGQMAGDFRPKFMFDLRSISIADLSDLAKQLP